jgi:hypothetical protein
MKQRKRRKRWKSAARLKDCCAAPLFSFHLTKPRGIGGLQERSTESLSKKIDFWQKVLKNGSKRLSGHEARG